MEWPRNLLSIHSRGFHSILGRYSLPLTVWFVPTKSQAKHKREKSKRKLNFSEQKQHDDDDDDKDVGIHFWLEMTHKDKLKRKIKWNGLKEMTKQNTSKSQPDQSFHPFFSLILAFKPPAMILYFPWFPVFNIESLPSVCLALENVSFYEDFETSNRGLHVCSWSGWRISWLESEGKNIDTQRRLLRTLDGYYYCVCVLWHKWSDRRRRWFARHNQEDDGHSLLGGTTGNNKQ